MSNSDNSSTVLVVEDDASVRDLALKMLHLAGFTTLEAIDAKSGLEKFKQHAEIDLVFTDVIMPGGVSGIEMAREILSIKPHTPLLIVTGYLEKGAALREQVEKFENISTIEKPYDVKEVPLLISSMIAASKMRLN